MTPGVYRVWLSDSHFYVGRSSDIDERCQGHLKRLKRGKHPNPRMQATYNKYRVFRYEILEAVEEDRAKGVEQDLLDTHLSNPFCLNICPSAEFPTRKGRRNSEAHRAKISASRKGITFDSEARKNMSEAQKRRFSNGWSDELRAAMMKTRDTPEYREKLAASLRGKTLSPERRAKIAASGRGREVSEETREKLSKSLTGRSLSEGAREKLSAANLGRKLSEETKAKMRASQALRRERERSAETTGEVV